MAKNKNWFSKEVISRIPTVRLIKRGLFPGKKQDLLPAETEAFYPAMTYTQPDEATGNRLYDPLANHIRAMAAEKGIAEPVRIFIRRDNDVNASADQGSFIRPRPPTVIINTGMLEAHGYYLQQPPAVTRSLNAVLHHELDHAANTRWDRLKRHLGGAVAALVSMAAVHYIGGKLGQGRHRILQWGTTLVTGMFGYDLTFSWCRRREEDRADDQIPDPTSGLMVRMIGRSHRKEKPENGFLAVYDRLLSGHPTPEHREMRLVARGGNRAEAESAVARLQAQRAAAESGIHL